MNFKEWFKKLNENTTSELKALFNSIDLENDSETDLLQKIEIIGMTLANDGFYQKAKLFSKDFGGGPSVYQNIWQIDDNTRRKYLKPCVETGKAYGFASFVRNNIENIQNRNAHIFYSGILRQIDTRIKLPADILNIGTQVRFTPEAYKTVMENQSGFFQYIKENNLHRNPSELTKMLDRDSAEFNIDAKHMNPQTKQIYYQTMNDLPPDAKALFWEHVEKGIIQAQEDPHSRILHNASVPFVFSDIDHVIP